MAEADASLGTDGYTLAGNPAYRAALKTAPEGVNNNTGFVQPGPESCPPPVLRVRLRFR